MGVVLINWVFHNTSVSLIYWFGLPYKGEMEFFSHMNQVVTKFGQYEIVVHCNHIMNQ